jgi:acetyl esterase/lipase
MAMCQIRTQKVGEFNLDVDKFAVGGTSAGGHLAAVVSHLCRDAGIRLGLQVLCVPVCDVLSVFTPEGEFDRANCPYESYREMEYTQPLPANRMAYFHRQFLGVPRPAPSDQVQSADPKLRTKLIETSPRTGGFLRSKRPTSQVFQGP